jgi:APA family basic amino acid/polyamine antiporter
LDAVGIVVSNVMGGGIFYVPVIVAGLISSAWVMLAMWVCGGVFAFAGAMAYAELAALRPRAGGEYVYLREAYHPAVGFMSGWVSLIIGFSAPIAGAALLFASYIGRVVPALAGSAQSKLLACVLILTMTALHAFDTRLGGRVQTAFTIAKVLLIMTFVIAGLAVGTGDWAHFAPRNDGLATLGTSAGSASYATALIYVSLAYSGWNAAAYIAGEIRHPQRTLPRALLLGTGVVMLLYFALNLVFLYAVSPDTMGAVDPNTQPVGDLAARALFGNRAGDLLSTLIALALVSAVSAMMMAGPRVYATMAADHALPHPLARYSARGVPSVAVAVQCVLALGFAIISDLGKLLEFIGFTLAIFAALAVGAVFILRARGKVSAFRTPGYPVTPLLFIALSAWTVYNGVVARPWLSVATVGVLVVGALVYLVTAHGKARTPIEVDE